MKKGSMKFIWHSRTLKALGPELVTNDLIAILELVKNSYDAGAKLVEVIFEYDAYDDDILLGEYQDPASLVIRDNGSGMSIDDIKNKWFVIGTPNKEFDNQIDVEGNTRYVSGSKGIGRLSAARLGNKLKVRTKKINQDQLEFSINWEKLFNADELPAIELFQAKEQSIAIKGTDIEIEELSKDWTEDEILELSDGLSRLITPFKPKQDFSIVIIVKNQNDKTREYAVDYKEFLDKPVYKVSGIVDNLGNINGNYEYLPLGFSTIQRSKVINESWRNVIENRGSIKRIKKNENSTCGEFTFEIRCWDIDANSTEAITDLYNIKRAEVRKNIRYYKGISVYRDDVLVLPKDESNRDWLGLDLKRVSRVGDRISTNQIVGCINIGNSTNPNLQDASDRDGLANNSEVEEFKLILLHIIRCLQTERSIDKIEKGPSLIDLFSELNADELLGKLEPFVESGQISLPALNIINKFAEELESKRKKIESHFRYYGQLATLGQISGLILHEVRNSLIPIGALLKDLKNKYATMSSRTKIRFTSTDKAVRRLEELANKFVPLASRRKSKDKFTSINSTLNSVMLYLEKETTENNIQYIFDTATDKNVEINPAELEIILLNLLLNAIYWVKKTNDIDNRYIWINVKSSRKITEIEIIDNGPGIPDDEVELVFEPGITRKPDGIGMGLPICVYFLDQNNGNIYYENNSLEKGAKFVVKLRNWEEKRNESINDR